MTTTLTWPAALIPQAQQFFPAYTTRMFESPHTGKSQTVELPVCAWQCQLSFKNLNRDEKRLLETFIMQLRGAAGRFRLGDQAYAEPKGAAVGTPIVSGANQSGTKLVIKGCKPGQNFLAVGDYFTVNNELKRLVADANADSAGITTLNFEPNLRNSPKDKAPVIVRNAYCIMRLVDDKQGQLKRIPMFGSGTVNCVEDVY